MEIKRINVRALMTSVALVTAGLFVLCSIWVAASPESFMAAAGYLSHSDLSGLARPLTWGNFIGGVIAWTAGVALVFGLGAKLYNRYAAGEQTRSVTPGRETTIRSGLTH